MFLPILRRPTLLVFVVALFIRVVYCVIVVWVLDKPAPGGTRHDGYVEIARNLANGEGYTLAGEANFFRPPTYVLFLVPWVVLPGMQFWILGTQSMLGAATCALTTAMATRWLRTAWAVAAGMVVALCPWHVHFTANGMTPVLASFLTALFLWLWIKSRDRASPWISAACGVDFSLLALCHPSVVLLGPFWVVDRLVRAIRSRGIARGLFDIASFAMAAGLIMSPWVIRNYRAAGVPILLTNSAGFQYFVADDMVTTTPHLFAHPPHGIRPGIDRAIALLEEKGYAPNRQVAAYQGVGVPEGRFFDAWMKQDLLHHPEKLPRRLFLQAWWFWFGDRPSMVLLHLAYKAPLLILAVVGCWVGLRRRLTVGPIVVAIVAPWLVHSVIMGYIPLSAYSLVVFSPLGILAAMGAAGLADGFRPQVDTHNGRAI